MQITSPAFGHNEEIPTEYTCDGPNISPELRIDGIPENTKSLVLINDDPDAPGGVWDHWIIFNMPPALSRVDRGKEPEGLAGKNSWERTGYGGPCPPSGTHRYYFRLYALDTVLSLPQGSLKAQIEAAMEGHIIDSAELMGLYTRG